MEYAERIGGFGISDGWLVMQLNDGKLNALKIDGMVEHFRGPAFRGNSDNWVARDLIEAWKEVFGEDDIDENMIIDAAAKIDIPYREISGLKEAILTHDARSFGKKRFIRDDKLSFAIKTAIQNTLDILITGPTGTGKTWNVIRELESEDIHYEYIACSGGMEDRDLLGGWTKSADGLVYSDGPLTRAFKKAQTGRSVIVVDEINRMPARYLNILIGAMNEVEIDKRQLYIFDTGETIKVDKTNIEFIACRNAGDEYAGIEDMDIALERRFAMKVEADYLGFADEVNLIIKKTGIDQSVAQRIVRVAENTRHSSMLRTGIDTASAIEWSNMYLILGDLAKSAELTVASLILPREGGKLVNKEILYDAIEEANRE